MKIQSPPISFLQDHGKKTKSPVARSWADLKCNFAFLNLQSPISNLQSSLCLLFSSSDRQPTLLPKRPFFSVFSTRLKKWDRYSESRWVWPRHSDSLRLSRASTETCGSTHGIYDVCFWLAELAFLAWFESFALVFLGACMIESVPEFNPLK